jgi:hypothetical protein
MTEQEVNVLIAEYNAVEAQQTTRLRAIFDFVKARKYYRIVKFGSPACDAWCTWDSTLAINHDYARFVDNMARPITEFVPGEE